MASETKQAAMLEASTPMICSSCHRIMAPHEPGVVFQCPNCGRGVIKRCNKCRKLSVSYTCPVCGFKGP